MKIVQKSVRDIIMSILQIIGCFLVIHKMDSVINAVVYCSYMRYYIIGSLDEGKQVDTIYLDIRKKL